MWAHSHTPVAFSGWGSGNPNNQGGNENCMEMNPTFGGWNDLHCNNVKRFVCEIDLK